MSRLRPCLLLSVLGGFAVCLVAALGAAILIPQQAEAAFGPPSPALSPLQRFTLSLSLLRNASLLTAPADSRGADVSFSIQAGEPALEIIERLAAQGLIAHPTAFRDYLVYTGIDTRLKPGQFLLSPQMTPVEIAGALEGFAATEAALTILPGWRLEEVAAALPSSGLEIAPELFLQLARTRPRGVTFAASLPPDSTHEGFLFPDTYTFPRRTPVMEFLSVLLSNFTQQVTAEMQAGFAAQGLSLYEAVILASIVEREGVVEEENVLIASVFLNRLQAGMRLQADPTVQYALGYNEAWGWWKSPLAVADLTYDSVFNTYLYDGLPPAPIASPGLPALMAVAFPAETQYFFFRAACDGSGRHIFAETFEEHQANRCP